MSWLKKLILALLLGGFLLVGGVAGLLSTTSGLHWAINTMVRWVPGLNIVGVAGGWRDLTLTQVDYHTPGITVNLAKLSLSLAPSCLLQGQLCLNTLTVNDAVLTIDTALLESTPQPNQVKQEPITELSTPYPIELGSLVLSNISITLDQQRITLAELRSGGEWRQQALALKPTKLVGLEVILPVSSESADTSTSTVPDPVVPLGESLQQLFAQPLLADLADITLPLAISVPEIVGENSRFVLGDRVQTVERWSLGATSQGSEITLQQFSVTAPEGCLLLTGSMTLAKTWPLDLHLDAQLLSAPFIGQKITLAVTGNLKQQLQLGLQLQGPVQAELHSQMNLAEAGLPLALRLQSSGLRWPLTGESDYRLDNLAVDLQGKATDYQLTMRTSLAGKLLPSMAITLAGRGDVEQFDLSSLKVATLQGQADLRGTFAWRQALSWNLQLALDGINTAKQWPQWPAKLQGHVASRGSWYGGSWQLQLPDIQLSGDVGQQALKLAGSVTGNAAGEWQIPDLALMLGRNNVHVQGELGEQWALDATINAPNLKGALPDLAGTVRGKLNLRGGRDAPQAVVNLSAADLRWQALQIGSVNIQGDVQAQSQIQGKLAVKVEALQQEALQISRLDLQAKGNEADHQLALQIEGQPIAGRLLLKGDFDRQQQRWQGRLHNTQISTPIGEWLLTRDIVMDYRHTEQTINIGAHCWRNPHAELCLAKMMGLGERGEISVDLPRLDLAMLQPFLDEETELTGDVSGRAKIRWLAQELPQINLSLAGSEVKLQQQIADQILPIDFDALTFNGEVKDGRASLDWLIQLVGNGQFHGQLQVADLQGKRHLSGNMAIERLSLAMINPLLLQGEKADGELNGNLRLAGNLQRPELFGGLALNQLAIDNRLMPFSIRGGHLAVNFAGFQSTLEGAIPTTQGQLNLNGSANWQKIDAWQATLAAKGEKIRVTVPPMVRIDVSPDVQLTATGQALTLTGRVQVPWARLQVQELPESAVAVSDDEVMLDEHMQPIATKNLSIPINTHLAVKLGDDVELNAFGLQTKLRGDLNLIQDHRGFGLNGRINLISGRFHAYGQDLLIRKGSLLFSGPPDQPMLDIEAIRNPESTENGVTAGVRVGGLANAPKLDIFSDPAMSQQEALSYLVRGQGLNSTNDESGMMTSMLIGLGVAKSGKLVGKIGETFGVSNLLLDTQGVGDKSQVVVSGYVFPGLQIKYGVGIFDSLATLTLRYRLMPKLYLQAVSGIDQALDLLYQFEF